jgi:alpha-1,3/alpha-1,6-mannosyltransferase
MTRPGRSPDVIFCDVVSHVIPFLKRLSTAPILYFCHFPDLLLVPEGSRRSVGYRLYRRPLDRLEESGVAAADMVVTNSQFTRAVVTRTFPSVPRDRLSVLYPGVDVDAEATGPMPQAAAGPIDLLSVNRFDPRKNLELAVDAMAALKRVLAPQLFHRTRLTLAGYYDERLPECRTLVDQLRKRAADCGVAQHVEFVFSPGEAERRALLARARCVLYTPAAEHFGYVPVEAMAASRPVVAVNNGGPSETVLDGDTGFLCEPEPDHLARALAVLVRDIDFAERLGRAGRERVRLHFSRQRFGDGLARLIERLSRTSSAWSDEG